MIAAAVQFRAAFTVGCSIGKSAGFALQVGGTAGAPVMPSTQQKNVLVCKLRAPWVTTMRSRVRRFAHVLERVGLAMAGAAAGLFVGTHVGSSIAALTSQGFLLIMMIVGAVGFYLGIDTPQLAFQEPSGAPSKGGSSGKIDTAEFLSAVGTFLAALTAFVSVGVIVLRETPHLFWTAMIMAGWVVGVTMQIIAGAIARTRA